MTNLDVNDVLGKKIKELSDVPVQSPYAKIDCPTDNDNGEKKCVVLDSKNLDLTGLSKKGFNIRKGNDDSADDFPTSTDQNFLQVLACYQREDRTYYLVVENFDFSFRDILNEKTGI